MNSCHFILNPISFGGKVLHNKYEAQKCLINAEFGPD